MNFKLLIFFKIWVFLFNFNNIEENAVFSGFILNIPDDFINSFSNYDVLFIEIY